MKWSLHSDLHIESNGKLLDTEQADAFVLAGDIGESWDGVRWAETWNKPVVYVPGNHEYYHQEYFALLAEFSSYQHQNVHILQNSAVVIDGVRWIGSTLWTDWARGHERLAQHAWAMTNDAREIKASAWWEHAPESIFEKHSQLPNNIERATINGWNPLLALQQHKEAVQALQRLWRVPFAGPTVVVTHHAPLNETLLHAGLSPELLNSGFWDHGNFDKTMVHRVALYASDLSNLVVDAGNHGVHLWVHGHLHAPVDYLFGKVRVMSNPKGHRIRGKLKSGVVQAKPYQSHFIIDPHKPSRGYFKKLRTDMAELIDETVDKLTNQVAGTALLEPGMRDVLSAYVEKMVRPVVDKALEYVNDVEQWKGRAKTATISAVAAQYGVTWPQDYTYDAWIAFLPVLSSTVRKFKK